MKNSPTPLNDILTTGEKALKPLLKKLDELEKLQIFVKTQIEPPLNEHCRVANYRDGCLILTVDSAAFATRLRYEIPDLLEKLRSVPRFCGLKTIEFSIKI
jgi:hypothetical protein